MAGPQLTQTQQQRLQMVLAPQLRQSLEFLQVPMLELRSLVRQELEQNPTIEERITDNERIEVEGPELQLPDDALREFGEEYELLAQLDNDWKEYFRQNAPRSGGTREDDERRKHLLDSISLAESLQEHLLHQLGLAGLSEQEKQIGELLVGNINDDGYLSVSLDELASSTGFDVAFLERVLAVIREFEPIGVGSRDLKECLLFQIEREGKRGTLAEAVVRDHLEALGARKYAQMAKALKQPVEQVHEIAHYIATLEPKPGRRFSSDTAAYVVPEVVVQKVNDSYVVSLNDEQIPHLRISKQYRSLMESDATAPEVKTYIMEKIRSGAFLIRSIHQRQQTIRNIATELVRVQEGFLDKGVAHLRPLTMAEVAGVLGIHETTVSRAVSGKYMQTPQGIYEMKYFFTPGYKRADGETISNKSIKDRIHHMIAGETPSAPLSDQALADRLKAEGLTVARRTVAKYREELKIPPSHLRKSF